MVWESIEKEEAEERRRATQNNKQNVDEGADWANLPTQTEKSNKGRASQNAAEKVGLKRKNYEKIKKVVKTADRLKEDNRTVAAKKLLNTLNSGSTDAAYKQIKDLNKVEGAIATRRKEAITEAAIGLADDEDKAIEVIRAIARKYPNAIRQAIEEF